MENLNSDANAKIHELQSREQALQQCLMQKQSIQLELNEVENALHELSQYKGSEVYRILGGIMIKSDAQKLKSELEEKKKMHSLRFSAFEKQEKEMMNSISALKKEIQASLESNKKNK